MAKITMEFECGCFKRSGYESEIVCPTNAEAVQKAEEMVEDMNESFCGVHSFSVTNQGEDVLIAVQKNF